MERAPLPDRVEMACIWIVAVVVVLGLAGVLWWMWTCASATAR